MANITKPIILDETFSREMNANRESNNENLSNLLDSLNAIASGAFKKQVLTQSSGNIVIIPNVEIEIPTLTGQTTITLGDGIDGKANEWVFQITQGDVAQTVVLPSVDWNLGIAPVFSANTTTEIRLYYIHNSLKGVWENA